MPKNCPCLTFSSQQAIKQLDAVKSCILIFFKGDEIMSSNSSKHNYILNFLPLPVVIRTRNGDYGPIQPDGEIVYDHETNKLDRSHPNRLHINQFFGGGGLRLSSYAWHVKVKMDDRFVALPPPRKNVLLLVGFNAACAIKMSGRDMSDIITPDIIREREGILYCDKLLIFR